MLPRQMFEIILVAVWLHVACHQIPERGLGSLYSRFCRPVNSIIYPVRDKLKLYV